MHLPKRHFWQQAPALRLLAPFIAGILVQWYGKPALFGGWIAIVFFVLFLILFSGLPLRLRFKATALQGFAVTGFVAATAMLVVQWNDVRNNPHWFGRNDSELKGVLLTVQEPLVEKPNSYKALATIEKMSRNDSVLPAAGKLILYFKKDAVAGLDYGSQLWVFEKVAAVKNSGNPAGFDYQRYSLFAGITHQVYLTNTDFIVLPSKKTKWYKAAIFALRQKIVTIIKTHIRGSRESGLAEALLIGYKDDLDKTLVQSYSNTGVVHIIAISGLHVGLIYGLLLWLTGALRRKRLRWLRFGLVATALWAFGFLAGAQPSVLRSVVMFSAIAAGVVLDRNANIYNNLALSALLLLCYNPFWLWDVGFQLSYTAVLSIVLFFKPIYNRLYLQNKALDWIWKLMAVTLAAQVLTTPISLYYFHQFPVLFLFTNMVAVPLSSLILFGEILLCLFFFIPPLATGISWLTTVLIRLMNGFIELMDGISFSVWPALSVSALQTLLLLFFIAAFSFWLLEKKRTGFWAALFCLLMFTSLRTFSFIHAARQQQLIVYNISKHAALDVFSGRQAWFAGDVSLLKNDGNTRLHLQPARIANRISNVCFFKAKAFLFAGKNILILDTTAAFQTFSKPHIDVLILSKNPKLYIKDLVAHFDIAQIVLDASVPAWKARLWQQDCDSLRLPCYNVVQKGAFVMTAPRPTFAAL